VNTPLTGEFSVSNACQSCVVSSNPADGPENWTKTYTNDDLVSANYYVTEPSFKINTPGLYSYTLKCVGADPKDIAINTTSLGVQSDGSGGVRAINLPWWKEIIPNLGGFLKGLFK
jgi:hypothetical protein